MAHFILIQGSKTLSSGIAVDLHVTYIAIEHVLAVKRLDDEGCTVVMTDGTEFKCNENADEFVVRMKAVLRKAA